jgi:hypothetical protein
MKPKNNNIELTDFQDWFDAQETTYAFNTRERKRICVDKRGCIKVKVAGEVVWQ